MSFVKKSWQSGFIVPIPLLVLLLILAALPLTVIVSQKQQEIRQRAAVIMPSPVPPSSPVSLCEDLADCAFPVLVPPPTCDQEGAKCKDINRLIYECRKQ